MLQLLPPSRQPIRPLALRRALALAGLFAAGGVGGCASATDSYSAAPFAMIIVAGDTQGGMVGQPLARPITIRVRDQRGRVLQGATVTWTTSASSGSAAPTSSRTDARGEASTTWRLGAVAGVQTLTASVNDLERTFTATATPVPAAYIVILPDSLSLDNGATDSIRATVFGADSLPLAGRPIVWSVGDSSVARVGSAGDVTGLSGGSTTVTATSGSATASIDVVVSTPVSSMSVGSFHTCAITTTNVAFCWGVNGFGQLGTGNTLSRLTPKKVNTPLIFSSITAGGAHSCAIAVDGTGWCWGSNSSGQLGTDSASNALVPRTVAGGFIWRNLTAGNAHTCGVTNTRAGMCWGLGDDGRLGDSTTEARSAPVAVYGNIMWNVIVPATAHTCGIARNGTAYCWGLGQDGRLGDSSNTSSLIPTPVAGGLSWTQITTGDRFSCGITTSGDAYCWGYGKNGRLGNGDVLSSNVPVLVAGGFTWRSINAGGDHTCAVAQPATMYCWGNNDFGQLGDGTTTSQSVPVRSSLTAAMVVPSAANGTSCGIVQGTRSLECWGNNSYGQIGNGSTISSAFPQRVIGP